MARPPSPQLRALLQDFVEARVDASELFERAGKLLPPGTDACEKVLEVLAEGDLKLTLAAGRPVFVRRLEQFARGDTSFTELSLWCFSLGQTPAFAEDAGPTTDAEVTLQREVLDWIEQGEDEEAPLEPEEAQTVARLLTAEPDPLRCREALAAARVRFGRN